MTALSEFEQYVLMKNELVAASQEHTTSTNLLTTTPYILAKK